MRIHIIHNHRKKPLIGDRRMTKKYGEQIRLPQTYQGLWVRGTRGYLHEWVQIKDVPSRFHYLLTKQEIEILHNKSCSCCAKCS